MIRDAVTSSRRTGGSGGEPRLNRRAAAGWLLIALAAGTPLDAQERLAVVTEPGTPVVATSLLLAVGPADEDPARSGISFLSARSLVAPIQPALDSLGAHLLLTPHKDALAFSLIAAPDIWEEASRLLVVALFRDPAETAVVTRERAAIAAELRGRRANPVDVASRELDRAFFGSLHPWARSEVGAPESIERITFDEVDEFVRAHFTPDRAFVAVVGPVDTGDAEEHLRPLLGSVLASPREMIPLRPAERPVQRQYNVITTWVSASFRFPESADEEALRLVAHLAAESLAFSPAQRSVFNLSSAVVPRLGGGEIRLQLVVPPDEAGEWAERIGAAVAELAERPMLDEIFSARLRRYRGERLMRMTAPEERAAEVSRSLLVSGVPARIPPDIDGLTQERMRAAARSLGAPTIVLLGPYFDDG
jgi:predicted Zn-dependent peptidase